jgi:hypothetical protein
MATTLTAPAAAPAINPADPGSAARMHHAAPGRKHPAEVVLGALLRGRSVDLPDGRTYRLGDDLTLGTAGIGPDDETGYVVTRDLTLGEFLRLSEQLSFNDVYLIGCDRVLAETSVGWRRARARPAPAEHSA